MCFWSHLVEMVFLQVMNIWTCIQIFRLIWLCYFTSQSIACECSWSQLGCRRLKVASWLKELFCYWQAWGTWQLQLLCLWRHPATETSLSSLISATGATKFLLSSSSSLAGAACLGSGRVAMEVAIHLTSLDFQTQWALKLSILNVLAVWSLAQPTNMQCSPLFANLLCSFCALSMTAISSKMQR